LRINPFIWRSVWWVILPLVLVSCKGEHSNPSRAPVGGRDGGPSGTERTAERAPPPGTNGDAARGAGLYGEHCAGCHGEDRRGAGPSRSRLSLAPRDLSDPLFLVTQGEGALARTALEGGAAVGLSKEMPRFFGELSEQDALDVAAFLKQGAVSLEECFPEATHYALLARYGEGTFVAAYRAALREGGHPSVVPGPEQLPPEARKLGYVRLEDVDLPQGGQVPGAVVARPDGTPLRVQVALARRERVRVEAELSQTLARYAAGFQAVAQGKPPPGYHRKSVSVPPGTPR